MRTTMTPSPVLANCHDNHPQSPPPPTHLGGTFNITVEIEPYAGVYMGVFTQFSQLGKVFLYR